jgi:hypothetical protein
MSISPAALTATPYGVLNATSVATAPSAARLMPLFHTASVPELRRYRAGWNAAMNAALVPLNAMLPTAPVIPPAMMTGVLKGFVFKLKRLPKPAALSSST